MMVELSFWQFISVVISLVGMFAGAMKLLYSLHEKSLDQRFTEIDKARAGGQDMLNHRLQAIEEGQRGAASEWTRLERALLELKAELPLQYVRREDYVRGQSVIEAKLDSLATRVENAVLRQGLQGARND
ncbi:membrane protein [Betaproteobacteria bacterium]|nr:membrane protein [Betaproteobacteria bacterium]